jgi:hypothetical protein
MVDFRAGSGCAASRVIHAGLVELSASIEAAKDLRELERLHEAFEGLCLDRESTVIATARASDKKRSGDELRFALPLAIGDVRVESVLIALLERFVKEAS